jgi:hypothetical protein
LVNGTAVLVADESEYTRVLGLLRERYPQYRLMDLTFPRNTMVRITPTKILAWGKVE